MSALAADVTNGLFYALQSPAASKALLPAAPLEPDASPAVAGPQTAWMRFRQRLAELVNEASVQDWNGPGTLPLRVDARERAFPLFTLLPPAMRDAEISCTPSGSLSLDWYAKPGLHFSILLAADNNIGYAAYFAGNRDHRTFQFAPDSLPKELSDTMAQWLALSHCRPAQS